ncbi:hypothetical protein FNV43_RR14755 [Rhamnella rubrinervis]|uniref:X8 domain-containing protein n=1 Tax=Rhamnella rubrinervis TaxID=2594499 RepID=A0A8K0H3I1_9ROSA|nr:hypothetical protein FNV43_RR14755 [Rhamnella rubrinervis]
MFMIRFILNFLLGDMGTCAMHMVLSICFWQEYTSYSDARSYAKMRTFPDPKLPRSSIRESMKKLQVRNHLRVDEPLDSFKFEPLDVSSPFSLPPFDSLSPLPSPGNVPLPPFCINPPPYTPQAPPKTPRSGEPPPPPPSSNSNSPPRVPPPSPRGSAPSPVTSPSGNGSSPHPPPKHGPSPPALPPPVVYPPPSGPVPPGPPAHKKPQNAVWCVAKPTVPDAIIQAAMDYACGSGADCKSIQPNGSCFQPDTLVAHASYAFNSYWQNTKAGGGTCDFGGTAMLVTVDPSYEKCNFVYA